MKLQIHKPQYNFCASLVGLNRKTQPLLQQYQQEFQAYTWVKLLESPSPFSFDQALLLCEHSENQWYVWIPDYGAAVMHVSQLNET